MALGDPDDFCRRISLPDQSLYRISGVTKSGLSLRQEIVGFRVSLSVAIAVVRISDRTARPATPRGDSLREYVQKAHARIPHEF